MEPFLKVSRIVKNFGGVKALKGVDFELIKGEVHALVGENGAGKSTLIKIISGVIQPDDGEIFIEGEKVRILNPKDAHEKGIATVYQEPLVYKKLSVVENIFLGNEIKTSNGSINWKAQVNKCKELFKLLDIDPYLIHTPMGELSVGLQQLVLIAKALNYSAKVLIFDEPTAILTEIEAEKLFKIIKKLSSQGVAILYISHRLEEIFRIANRVTVFRDGKREGAFDIEEVNRDKIIELMAGKALIETIERQKNLSKSPILEVHNLTSPYFKDISFSLYAGEILGFSGLIGSGRSELMQTIFGLIKKDSGKVILNGEEIEINSPEVAMKYGIAYLPEDRANEGLFLRETIKFNISIPILKNLTNFFFKIDNKKENELAQKAMDAIKIKAPSILTVLNNLSGGNQQKVLLEKWLLTYPKILILDEPTRGVDVGVKVEIHKEIVKLAEKGMAIIVVSSELPEVIKLSDRVIVMHEGSISGKFNRKEEITPKNLISAATGIRKAS